MTKFIDRKFSVRAVAAVGLFAFGWGLATFRFNVFPYSFLVSAQEGAKAIRDQVTSRLPWYYVPAGTATRIVADASRVAPGLTLITGIGDGDVHFIRAVDVRGAVVHEWKVDWFDIWPDATHIPDDIRPQSRPGASVHGTAFFPDGSVAVNFEYLGLVRMDACGKVMWKLPYQTHHSLSVTERGTIWASGRKTHNSRLETTPGYAPPFFEDTVVEVSADGQIIREISVFDILRRNGLQGLLYMDPIMPKTADVLHLNDVEEFPTSMPEGVFRHGDIMISLNWVNTVLVVEPRDLSVRFISSGAFVHQHDPDFVDGNTILVFDNNLVGDTVERESSKIVRLAADSGKVSVVYQGTPRSRFFTPNLGRLQLLSNGNVLVDEAREGRVFEFDSKGERVWEFDNVVRDGILGVVEDAQRLPPQFSAEYFAKLKQACPNGMAGR